MQDSSGEIRVGVITQKDGRHQDLYLGAIANSSSVSSVAIADAGGTTFKAAKEKLAAFDDFRSYRDAAVMISEFRPELGPAALPADRASVEIRSA